MSEPLNPSETGDSKDSENRLLCDLLAAISRKDKCAFEQFYDLTIERFYRLAKRITQSDNMADEVISDLYLQVWQQAERYSPSRGSVMAWVSILCRSRALDALRKYQRQSMREEPIDSITLPADSCPTMTDLLIEIQNKSLVHSALSSLDESTRQLVTLAYFKGFTHSELARLTDAPIGTVKTKIRRAVAVMKKQLSEHANCSGEFNDKS